MGCNTRAWSPERGVGGGGGMVGQKGKCCILVSLSARGALSSKSDPKKCRNPRLLTTHTQLL